MDSVLIANVQGLELRELTLEAHRSLVAELSDAARDYGELVDGKYQGSVEAVADIFAGLPPGRTLADKVVWGLFESEDRLAGVVEMMRNYNQDGCLWIGLLLLRPERRNGGLGAAIIDVVADWAVANGFTELGLGVVEHNEKALRFWQRQGFVEFRRREGVPMGKLTNTVIAMRRALAKTTR